MAPETDRWMVVRQMGVKMKGCLYDLHQRWPNALWLMDISDPDGQMDDKSDGTEPGSINKQMTDKESWGGELMDWWLDYNEEVAGGIR